MSKKGETYVARFRDTNREYKKSLKTSDLADARAAMHSVEQTLHRILTGLIQVPEGVDPGDFIISAGTLTASSRRRTALPILSDLVGDYLANPSHVSPSYLSTLAVHLRNFARNLGTRTEQPIDRITHRDLDQYLQLRLRDRTGDTVFKERFTLINLFDWAVAHGHLTESPALRLPTIKGNSDKPPFRTTAEIEAILSRGGLDEVEAASSWDSLYLLPSEIADLLAIVKSQSTDPLSPLLHLIPAYTGMRRGEILRLVWSDIEFEHESILARSRKQSRQRSETVRRIDLHPELKILLLRWREASPRGQDVISEASSARPLNVQKATPSFCQPLRGTPWCLNSSRRWFKVGFHTYRHSFASNLAARGVDQRIIDEWMGHQTEAMRKRYRHLFPKDRRSAIESFSLVGDRDAPGA